MHMWMWFGFDLGEFMFSGLTVATPPAFALTWVTLFFVALLFEASKVYLARVQRDAIKQLHPYRCDERRGLLCDREQGTNTEPSTSRNASSGQMSRWSSLRVRTAVNAHQTLVFLLHNVVGYLLMLAVMLYNVHLLLAVVTGMMLGYFLFGPKLTRLQLQCVGKKRAIICTPECDDMAETSTPPLLDASLSSSESEIFICRTRTCIQPSHYFPARTEGAAGDTATAHATCYYGAKECPSRVARAKKMKATAHCSHESEKEDSPSVEDAQLLRTERQGCCKKKQEPPPPEKKCCKKSSQSGSPETTSTSVTTVVPEVKPQSKCCKKESEPSEERSELQREDSPQITCCHTAKVPSESQEQIIT